MNYYANNFFANQDIASMISVHDNISLVFIKIKKIKIKKSK
jgi:hypothetical protein